MELLLCGIIGLHYFLLYRKIWNYLFIHLLIICSDINLFSNKMICRNTDLIYGISNIHMCMCIECDNIWEVLNNSKFNLVDCFRFKTM